MCDVHVPLRPPRPGRHAHSRLRRLQQACGAITKQAASPGAGDPPRRVHPHQLSEQSQEVVATDVGVGGTDLRGDTSFQMSVIR